MQLDLTEEETFALPNLLVETIEADRYPLSPRIRTLSAMLARIEPSPTVAAEPFSAIKPGEGPRAALRAPKRRKG
jgi:hypothetical protein